MPATYEGVGAPSSAARTISLRREDEPGSSSRMTDPSHVRNGHGRGLTPDMAVPAIAASGAGGLVTASSSGRIRSALGDDVRRVRVKYGCGHASPRTAGAGLCDRRARRRDRGRGHHRDLGRAPTGIAGDAHGGRAVRDATALAAPPRAARRAAHRLRDARRRVGARSARALRLHLLLHRSAARHVDRRRGEPEPAGPRRVRGRDRHAPVRRLPLPRRRRGRRLHLDHGVLQRHMDRRLRGRSSHQAGARGRGAACGWRKSGGGSRRRRRSRTSGPGSRASSTTS